MLFGLLTVLSFVVAWLGTRVAKTEVCGLQVCSSALCGGSEANPNLPCSARDAMVDPFLCEQGLRCFQTTCGETGRFQNCKSHCEEFKDDWNLDSSDYPDCEDTCDEVTTYRAFLSDCNNANRIGNGEPECYPYYPCSGEYCGGGDYPNSMCSAEGMVVDPYSNLGNDDCKVLSCDSCGAQSQCRALCEAERDSRNEDSDDLNCRLACRDISDYKCFASS